MRRVTDGPPGRDAREGRPTEWSTACQQAEVPAINPAQVNCWWNWAEVCTHNGYGHPSVGHVIATTTATIMTAEAGPIGHHHLRRFLPMLSMLVTQHRMDRSDSTVSPLAPVAVEVCV
jgi:hypothetical protein